MIFNHCRSCGNPLEDLLSLGELYISNFIDGNASSDGHAKSDITLSYCGHCTLFQLKESVDPDILYQNYWYKSGINNSMRKALQDVAFTAIDSVKTNHTDIFLDIACNDGTLLDNILDMVRVGVDPSNVANVNGGTLIKNYFTANNYLEQEDQAKIITCIAMFYDVDDPRDFLRDVHKCLRDDGLFVVQMSYTPLMFKQMAFDNMCAEHVSYYSLTSLEYVLNASGFKIVDCTLNDVNGGSFRVFCVKDNVDVSHFRTKPERDVANVRLSALRQYENTGWDENDNHSDPIHLYEKFRVKLEKLRRTVRCTISDIVELGATVYAYGASTKGNTLLQYFGLDNTLVTAAVEINPDKVGLKTIGTEIPIISEEMMRENPPDYLLILPWHFIKEFTEREREFLKGGGKFIVPCPDFEIIEYNE